MTEVDRLELVSTVEDDFSDTLQRFEKSLDSIDTEIQKTGGGGSDEIKVDLNVTGLAEATSKLKAFEEAVDSIDDDLDIDLDGGGIAAGGGGGGGGGGGPTPAMTSGGREAELFDESSLNTLADTLGSRFDRDVFIERGGEVSRPIDVLDGDIGDVVNTRRMTDALMDGDLDASVVDNLVNPSSDSDFLDAVDTLRGRDMTTLGRERTLAGRMKEVGRRFKDIHFTMGSFHNIIAALIPLAAQLVGALPAAIVGIAALGTAAIAAAGALVGIGGLGIMGMMLEQEGELSTQPIREELERLKESFVEAFGPLAKQLAPMAEFAFTELNTMLGPLADAAQGIQMFRDEFKTLGNFLSSAIPSFTKEMLAFGAILTPVLGDFFSFLSGMDMLGGFANELSFALGPLTLVGNAVMEMLPHVIELSQGFLMFTGVLFHAIGFIAQFADIIPFEILGGFISLMLVAATATTIYTLATESALATTIKFAASALASSISKLLYYTTTMSMATATTWGFYIAVAAVLSVLTLGIIAVTQLASGFSLLGSNIKDARRELEKFAGMNGSIGGPEAVGMGSDSPYAGSSQMYQDNSTTVINTGDKDSAARQQYASEYERRQQVDSVFGG